MPLTPGTKLGQYEVVESVGAGGMGEVYRARDTKLGRDVAIKILPEEFARDKERLDRFEREARLLAQLNHANIATLYGLEEHDGQQFIVMEMVEGETLAERIAKGPLPIDEVIPLFIQIAEGLEAAHEKGIIHRDLKPANIKIGPDGKPKILDFGLAKALVGEQDAAPDSSQSPTLTKGTALGAIMGTASYMSPEQARGKTVDKRADIWAFGVVLFESLTGERAFPGEDGSESVAFVLAREPAWDALPSETPSSFRRLLTRCLNKNHRDRLADISDARIELNDATSETAATPAEPSPSTSRRSRLLAVGALLLGSLATGLVVSTLSRELTPSPARVTVNTQPDFLSLTDSIDIAVSPDGSHIAYSSFRGTDGLAQLSVRPVNDFESTILADGAFYVNPFFSPDGEWVGFFNSNDDTLRKVSVLGGPAQTICELPGTTFTTGASWGADGTIVFATYGNLWRVPASGGEPEELRSAGGRGGYVWPQILPGGGAALVTVLPSQADAGTNAQIRVLSLDTLEETTIVNGGTNARYVPTGHLVYGDGLGTLLAVAFDLDRLEVVGPPVLVLEGVLTDRYRGGVDFGVSESGTLAYVPDTVDPLRGRGVTARLTWVTRDGQKQPLAAEPRVYMNPRISPDGRRVALDIRDQGSDVWLWDFTVETLTRLTFDPSVDGYPVWAPDGRSIVFESHRDGQGNIYAVASDGTGQVSRISESRIHQSPLSVSPDGKWLVFEGLSPELFLGVVSLDGNEPERTLLQENYAVTNGEVSPDGRWLTYQSEASGRFEIYVQTFPNVDEGRWQISNAGGTEPLWAPSGRELFFVAPGNQLMAVPVETDPTFSAGKPVALLSGDYLLEGMQEGTGRGRSYDVDQDGSRFLMLERAEQNDDTPPPTEIRLILNWFDELERLVPTN